MVERYRPRSGAGYGNPPYHARFKKGQSGNPGGRPRNKSVSVATLIAEELQSAVYISENGTRKKIDKLRLVIKQAINQAIGGNPRPLVAAMRLLEQLERINHIPTKARPQDTSIKDIDLTKLSMEELHRLYKTVIANSKPLTEM